LFADDVTLFPDSEGDAREMLRMVHQFGEASGSRLNTEKSLVAMALPGTGRRHYAGLRVLREGEKVKSLGMEYGPGLQPQQQWEQIMKRMRERVRTWGKREGLSVYGRVLIANTLVTSMITYHAAFLRPTEAQCGTVIRSQGTSEGDGSARRHASCRAARVASICCCRRS
jgi:hypothetical protein